MEEQILQNIKKWLKSSKNIDSEINKTGLIYKISGTNNFLNRVVLHQKNRVLSWYGYTEINPDRIKESPNRQTLLNELLRINERLFIGRWALTSKDMLVFDISIPISDQTPDQNSLEEIFTTMVKKFDHFISQIRFLLDTGLILRRSETDLPISYLQTLINRPDTYPLMNELGLISDSADQVLRQLLPLPALSQSNDFILTAEESPKAVH